MSSRWRDRRAKVGGAGGHWFSDECGAVLSQRLVQKKPSQITSILCSSKSDNTSCALFLSVATSIVQVITCDASFQPQAQRAQGHDLLHITKLSAIRGHDDLRRPTPAPSPNRPSPHPIERALTCAAAVISGVSRSRRTCFWALAMSRNNRKSAEP